MRSNQFTPNSFSLNFYFWKDFKVIATVLCMKQTIVLCGKLTIVLCSKQTIVLCVKLTTSSQFHMSNFSDPVQKLLCCFSFIYIKTN